VARAVSLTVLHRRVEPGSRQSQFDRALDL
jgi:hypothetical protein